MSLVAQSLHFGCEPVTSGLHPTPDMSPRRNNVPGTEVTSLLTSWARARRFEGCHQVRACPGRQQGADLGLSR